MDVKPKYLLCFIFAHTAFLLCGVEMAKMAALAFCVLPTFIMTFWEAVIRFRQIPPVNKDKASKQNITC